MDLPTVRELELETLLRERESRIQELTDEVSTIRRSLPSQQAPRSSTEQTTLSPALLSLILPHLSTSSPLSKTFISTSTSSNSVTTALTHRVKLLQEENDEMYSLLRRSDSGKLQGQVHGMTRTISRLEAALQESHAIIKNLSTELDKAYETIQAQHTSKSPSSQSVSPTTARAALPSGANPHSNNENHRHSKLPPTGPRAQKRPRLSSPSASVRSPKHRSNSTSRHDDHPRGDLSPPHHDNNYSNSSSNHSRNRREDSRGGRASTPSQSAPSHRSRGNSNGMEVDSRPRSRERYESYDRDDRDYASKQRRRSPASHDRSRRGNPGSGSASSSRRPPRNGNATSMSSHRGPGDRGLVERMGL